MIFDNFGRHFGAPRGSQGPPEQKIPKKETHFSLGRDPRRGTFGPSLALNFQKGPVLRDFW